MKASQILSRRKARKVDFRPDTDPTSPDAQLRRLGSLLKSGYIGPDDEVDSKALDEWAEYLYRKIFTGTSHNDYRAIAASDPEHVEWAIAVHEVETEAFRSRKS